MDGFKRTPKRQAELKPRQSAPLPPVAQPEPFHAVPEPRSTPLDSTAPAQQRDTQEVNVPRRRVSGMVIGLVLAVLVVVGGIVAYVWYTSQLKPVNPQSEDTVRFEVKDGSTFSDVVSDLKQRKLIRSERAFEINARLSGESNNLKASTCSLKQSMSSVQILKKLVDGCHDFISVMFYPGATIEKPLYKPADATIDQDKMYIKYRLSQAGFSADQISSALGKQYDSPLFAGKPAGASLEGYIFGETYYIDKTATAEDVLQETFAEMNRVITSNDLVAKYKAHNLNLYQGITLASVVQRELNCEGKPTEERKQRCYGYQQRIAQVFLNRLAQGISLGSDVTFIYAADQMGVTPSVDLESPYNTRIHTGLPPGPIASPGALALKAVGNPSGGDDLYFIAGDDGLIYFAKDEAGHQKNIREHCQQLCGNAV